MTDHANTPITGLDLGHLFRSFPSRRTRRSYVERTAHLTLVQHSYFVALEDLVVCHGPRAILDDDRLVCRVLGCTLEQWEDDFGPAIVPLLDLDVGERA